MKNIHNEVFPYKQLINIIDYLARMKGQAEDKNLYPSR